MSKKRLPQRLIDECLATHKMWHQVITRNKRLNACHENPSTKLEDNAEKFVNQKAMDNS